MSEKGTQPKYSEQILEMRFRPDPEFLDRRGAWAQLLKLKLEFKTWEIGPVGIELRSDDKPGADRVFVGLENCGCVACDSDAEHFVELADKAIKAVATLPGFGDPRFVTRLGYRLKTLCAHNGSPESLAERLLRLAPLSSGLSALTGSRFYDYLLIVNGKESDYSLRLQTGMMSEQEVRHTFLKRKETPALAWVADFDFSRSPEAPQKHTAMLATVKPWIDRAWSKYETLNRLVFGA